MLTFQDTVERLLDYLGADPADAPLRDAKQASIEALRDMVQSYTWTYLYSQGRIQLLPAYDQGLVTYAASGNLCPNQVTLTGGMFPSWAGLGVIRIGLLNHDVAALINGTTLQLNPEQAPGRDLTNPLAYGLFRDSYSMPPDFAAMDKMFIPEVWGDVVYVHPRDWMFEVNRWGVIGNPRWYTIMPDPDLGGRLAMMFAPLPTIPFPVEFLYKRHSNPLRLYKVCQGTIATAPASNTIVGTGTAFTQAMVGNCVLRISDTTKPPTAEFGDNPYVFESKITGWSSATQIATWDTVPSGYTSAPYTISSWVDIETGAMEQAYLRCCEMHISMSRVLKDKPSASKQYERALEVAKCADARDKMTKVASVGGSYHRRLKDYPINLYNEA